MDINRPLPMHALSAITQLAKGHPVWKVEFGPDALVLKCEDVRKRSHIADPAAVMQVVDPGALNRIVNKDVVMKLRSWAQRNTPGVDEKDAGMLDYFLGGALALPVPGQPPAKKPVFFVMEMKQNLRDIDQAGLSKRGGSKAMVKQLHEVFKQQGTLEKLGEIIAADAFIGNQDRVNFEAVNGKTGQSWPGPDDLAPGEQPTRLQCLQNPGNIFVADQQGRATLLGLDTIDPGNMFKDLESWSQNSWYPGQLLHQKALAQRSTICRKVMDDMNVIMGPRNRSKLKPLAKKTYMPSNSATRIEQGMSSGADKLLAHFKTRYRNGGVPLPLQHRFNACGWMNHRNFPRL